jgi:signal transduction histidine kinase
MQMTSAFDEASKCVVFHTVAFRIDGLKQERSLRIEAERKAKEAHKQLRLVESEHLASEARAGEAAALTAIAMVSHELRNCTQSIHMTVSTMASKNTTETQLRELATSCETLLEHLRRTLNGAIELGTLVSDVNKKVDPVPVSVQSIIRNAVQGQANFATSSNI